MAIKGSITWKVKPSKAFPLWRRSVIQKFEKALKDYEAYVKPQIMKMTPLDEGDLRDSYKFTKTSPNEWAISFGGPQAPYAVVVHNWPTSNINWTTAGTGAGFLRIPINNTTGVLFNFIKRGLK